MSLNKHVCYVMQVSKKFYNKCSKNSSSQIVSRTDIFPKIAVGCPCVYWTASIVEWNISESFSLQHSYRCVLLVSLFFEKEWTLICCTPAIKNRSAQKLHRRPKPSLASYPDVKGILRGFVRLSLSIPPEYRIGRLRGRLPKVSCVSDFR